MLKRGYVLAMAVLFGTDASIETMPEVPTLVSKGCYGFRYFGSGKETDKLIMIEEGGWI